MLLLGVIQSYLCVALKKLVVGVKSDEIIKTVNQENGFSKIRPQHALFINITYLNVFCHLFCLKLTTNYVYFF